MDIKEEDHDSRPNQYDFELTHFMPHGSSTQFFKPPRPLKEATFDQPTSATKTMDKIAADRKDNGSKSNDSDNKIKQDIITKHSVFQIVKEVLKRNNFFLIFGI